MSRWLGAILLLALPAFGQRADFFREDVTFRSAGPFLRIQGLYWFANPSDSSLHGVIFYPFPDSAGGPVDSVQIFDLSAGRPVGFRFRDRSGVSFPLFIAPSDTALIRIEYRQVCRGDSAVYILRTTRTWEKPLKRADFNLVVPDSIALTGCSYEPERIHFIGRDVIYTWRMTGFMPDRDLIFHFTGAER